MKLYLIILSAAFFVSTQYACQNVISELQAKAIAAKHGLTLNQVPLVLAVIDKKTAIFNKQYPYEELGKPFHEYKESLPIKNIEDISFLKSWLKQH